MMLTGTEMGARRRKMGRPVRVRGMLLLIFMLEMVSCDVKLPNSSVLGANG